MIPKSALDIRLNNWPGLSLILVEDGTTLFFFRGEHQAASDVYEMIYANLQGQKFLETGKPLLKIT